MSTALTPIGRRQVRRGPLTAWSFFALLAAALVAVLIGSDLFSGSTPTLTGSGVALTQTRRLPPFGSVDVTGLTNLTVQVGPRQSVVVRADDNIVSRITTRVVSGKLVIGNKPGRYSVRTPIEVRLAVPSLGALTLEGSGDINARGIHAGALNVSLAGFGTIRASGTAASLHVTLSGAGDAQLDQLTARDATAVITGDGEVLLTATNSVNATITGNGTIRYRGDPRHVTSSVTGSGAIGRS